jgi:hypothetical protein
MKKEIKKAKNKNKYLKITKDKEPTICIFENQFYIFDYFYYLTEKINCEFYILESLSNLINENNYKYIKKAWILRKKLKDFWNDFNHPYWQIYNPEFYNINEFDDSDYINYDHWGNYISDDFKEE